jgi:nicotinamidase-related amidase
MEPYVTPDTLEAKTREWLARIAPFNTHEMPMRPARAALLVVDMQLFFLDPASPAFTCGGPAVLPSVRLLVDAFRAAGRPVIFTRHVHHPDGLDAGIMGWWWEGMCREGTPESGMHPDLLPLPSEKVVSKHRYSAFFDTDLGTVLRCQGIEDLAIAGVMTNMCCEATARDAFMRDHRVFFPADATGAVTEEMHLASLLNLAFGFAFVTTAGRILGELAAQDR